MRFMLDVHLPVAFAVSLRDRNIDIIHVVEWADGALREALDIDILAVAAREKRILLTSDRRTVTSLLRELWDAGRTHAGVIFVDTEQFPARDIGAFQRAVLRVIRETGAWDWTHRIMTLEPVALPE